MKGMEDTSTRSGLLWEVERILKECKSYNGNLPTIALMENVPEIIGSRNIEHFKKWQYFLETLGYKNYVEILNGKDYGIPQNRRRCFMVSILGDYNYIFPKKQELKLRLKDMLEDEVDEKYFITESKLEKIINWKGYENPLEDIDENRICSTITTHCGKDSNGMQLVEVVEKKDNLKTRLCNSLIENNVVKENYVINHSYTNGLNVNNPNSRQTLEDYIESIDNIMPTLKTRPDILGVCIKEKTKKGYAKAYERDGIYINRPQQKRGVVQSGMIQTLKTSVDDIGVVVKNELTPKLIGGIGEKKSNGGTQYYQQDRVYSSDSVAMCHPANLPSGSYMYDVGLRIRKLTPRECFRLMGVKDEDFEKVSKNQSNSSLYHMAGDSIIVNVLMAIFKQLL